MTNISKRRPGRPAGSSRNSASDHALLMRIAEKIVAEPGLRPTEALRQFGVDDESALHRLRRKWKAGTYLSAAQARRDAQAETARAFIETCAGADRALKQVTGGFVRWVQENPETIRRMQEVAVAIDNGIKQVSLRLMRYADENPALMKALANPSVALIGSQRQINQ